MNETNKMKDGTNHKKKTSLNIYVYYHILEFKKKSITFFYFLIMIIPNIFFPLLLNNDMNFYAIRRFLSLLDASGYVKIHMGIKLLMATIEKDLQIWLVKTN